MNIATTRLTNRNIVPIHRMNSLTIMLVASLALALSLQMMMTPVCGQITFSKDWRAGGKRSVSLAKSPASSASLSAHGITVSDVPCDKLDDASNTKIRDLVRKEAIALLQCEFSVNKDNNKEADELFSYAGRRQ